MFRPEGEVFRIDVAHGTCAYVVALFGELDLAGCAALETALIEAEQSGAASIVVDIENLTFTDSRGMNVLMEAAERSAGSERLRVTRGTGQVARALRITGLDARLPTGAPAGSSRPLQGAFADEAHDERGVVPVDSTPMRTYVRWETGAILTHSSAAP